MTEPLTEAVAAFERYLERRIGAIGLPSNLDGAVSYAVLGPGKRLRPALTMLCCEAVGGRRDDALAPAASLELVHCFSLVHDDLPAMDDDTLRRGRPTLHIQAGEAMAILAGDALLSLAFQWVAELSLDADQIALITGDLASATTAMIVGQVYDTLGGFADDMPEPERLHLIHRNKTEALIRAACRIGGICGRATDEQLDALTRYGSAIGLMFQIIDDLLDVTQSTEHIGKTSGKDTSAGKVTFPAMYGIDGSRREVRRLETDAAEALAPLGNAADALRGLCAYMAVRTK